MSDEITLGFQPGVTLTYGVYIAAGGVRTAAGTSLPEEGSTGYYHADNSDIVASDFVIVKAGTVVVAYGEYRPEVISLSLAGETLDDVIDEINENEVKIDQVIDDMGVSTGVWDERPKEKRADVIIG